MNKLEVAQEADNLFMSIVLNISGNRLGLVSYEDGVDRTLELTDNQNALEYEISQYQAYGGTCICCGINEAVSIINSQSNESRRKNIVVMSDGEANRDCDAQQGTGDAAEDARNAACDAFQNYGITVDAVGFGDDANETTMQAIANCGNGSYYFSNVTDLASTYEEIAEDWINASYFAQTIIVYNMSLNNMLYPDSYIMFNYTSPVDPFEYGEISLNLESPRFGDLTGTNPITDNSTGTKEGWFYVPEGTEIVDAKITSYSSRYWTDRLYLRNEVTNWTRVFWLGEFNQPYMTLGDPYIIQIPTSYVNPGENNSVRIGTGVSVGNSTGGSPDDMVLYTIRISGITLEGYSNVFPRAEGCSRTIWFDIDNDDVADNYANIEVGDNPDDIFDPEHDAVDDALMRLMDKLNFINDDNPDGYGNGTAQNLYDGDLLNPIDLQITTELQFDHGYLEGIPTLWGPAVLEMRIWV